MNRSFKIWKSNNNYKYEKIFEVKDIYRLSDGIEIKDNEIILYAVNSKPQSLVFYNLNKKAKIKTLNNLNLCVSCKLRIIKINDNEVVVAGNQNVYLIDVNNYLILHSIYENYSLSILKLSNNEFLIGDWEGTISQYIIKNKKLIEESFKFNSHKNGILSITVLDDMIISVGYNSNVIKIWKNEK